MFNKISVLFLFTVCCFGVDEHDKVFDLPEVMRRVRGSSNIILKVFSDWLEGPTVERFIKLHVRHGTCREVTSRRTANYHPYLVAIPPIRTNRFQTSFIMRTAKEWNSLPASVFPSAFNPNLFKVRVNRLLLGSSCSWHGLQGRCTNINNCQSAKDAIRRKNPPLICSFQGKTPVVCCTICKRNVRREDSVMDPFEDFAVDSRFNQTSKARDNCLKYLKTLNYPCGLIFVRPSEERSFSDKNCNDNVAPSPLESAGNNGTFGDSIRKLKRHAENQSDDDSYQPTFPPPAISHGMEAYRRQYPHMTVPVISHGMDAFRRQFPHMALLGYGDDLKTAQWLCGGSVISEKYVLTAAHCISSPAVGSVKFIALGILKRSDPPELWQIHNVKRIIAHPGYQPPSKYNDIALLETENTISFNHNILPACLHLVPESDETAEATGWGALGHRQGLADTLQTVTLQRYDAEKCSQLYPKHRHLRDGYNHTTQMCYGHPEIAKDTCEGDSGGPLQTANQFSWCAYTVLGVTSYGRQCGISAGSGMYTRVYHYVPWIESVVWP